jgi:diaminopimelate epimerase
MRTLPFIKMHGLGNDFVIFDARTDPVMNSFAGTTEVPPAS